MSEEKNKWYQEGGFMAGLAVGAAVIAVAAFVGIFVMLSGDDQGTVNTNQAVNQPAVNQPAAAITTEAPTAAGISTFSVKAGAEVCKQDGKPVIYLFSTTWCPHCQWIKETFDTLVKKYVAEGKIVAYHWELDTGDDTLTSAVETAVPAEMEAVYKEFNPKGSIPTYVLGCKYFRVGNGYESQQDLKAEAAEIEAAIADLLK
ncbi:MAG: thioredoxin family protein [Patescibacteria group bacterium]|jgi:thiol-disulfide isomerase/thioredoxin